MEIRRVFVDKLKIKNGMVLLTGPMYKYIVTVLRKGTGDRVDILDGKGYLYRCTINGIKSRELYLKVLDAIHRPQDKKPGVVLCVSPIKGPRMDWLIEKATELGVETIIPTVFQRTIVKCEDAEKAKYGRWKRIIIEASRQSGRFTIPELMAPTPLREILSHIKDIKNRWILYEKEKATTIHHIITKQKRGRICVVIGPEGGIDDMEIQWLSHHGFVTCTLGENIFRTETTPLVILSIILYESIRK
ncbi:MAG TPA: hypothetical protein DDW17_04515 [Deltaproteobacteria bacterium]|nr:hypothetical protein [Deltaproteobacteria bacterium]